MANCGAGHWSPSVRVPMRRRARRKFRMSQGGLVRVSRLAGRRGDVAARTGGRMSVLLREIQARCATAAAVIVVAGAALAADTPPEAQRVQAVIDLLKKGDAAAAVAKLGEGAALQSLASDPY